MNDKILITLDVKNEGIPRIVASYLLTRDEWIPLKKFLQNDNLEIIFKDAEFCSEKIIINNNTLKITEDTNIKHIDSFCNLYKNNFFTYDLLMVIKDEMEKPCCSKKVEDIFEMEEENERVDYYLTTKKNTPEFSCLDDEKIKKMIMETKKTVNLFKNSF